jgi:hypothetical protein
MQAQHHARDHGRHSRDFHDHADKLEMRIPRRTRRICRRHCFSPEKFVLFVPRDPKRRAEARRLQEG